MKDIIRSFPLALKMILTDPINFVLSVIPSIMALAIYLMMIFFIYTNSHQLVSFFKGYIYTADQATILAKILTAVLVIFLFFVMSWTFVIVVGIISAPFNSLLSSRIEQKLTQRIAMDEDQNHAILAVKNSMKATLINEIKKFSLLLLAAGLAFLLNLFPPFYPIAVLLIAILLSVQFIDYSWSRHNIPLTMCLKDILKNIIPYSLSGAIFLGLVAIPLVNALIPAFATSYFTVLWLYRQKRLD
jgi:uncharacterized protein involved in cysteine biosynthesis